MKFLRSLETKGEKVPRGTSITTKVSQPYGLAGTPYQTAWSVERALKDGVDRDVWVYKATHAVASAEARLPIRLTSDKVDDNKDYDDDWLKLLNVQANPIESGRMFRYRLGMQLQLSKKGVFLELVRSRANKLIELHLLPPDMTYVVPDEDDYISGYEIIAGRYRFTLEPDRVLWIRRPHATDPYMGSTPMESAGLSVGTDFYARLYNRNYLQNDGKGGGIVGIKGKADRADVKELERRMQGGVSNAGKTSVVDGVEDLVHIDFSTTPKDMQYKDMRVGSKAEILGAFGVPESQLGDASGRTFDNADAEAVFFWAITMKDHNETVLEPFTMLRTGEQDDGLHYEHNVDDVEPLERLKRAQREEDRADVAAGIMTRDEYREKWGQEPTNEPGGQSLYVATGLTPITGPAKAAADKQAADAAKAQADAAKAALEGPRGPDGVPTDPAAAQQDASAGGMSSVRSAINPARAVTRAERAGKPRRMAHAPASKALPGASFLVPGAEEWGFHSIKAVSAVTYDGQECAAITFNGPLTVGEETMYYPATMGLKFSDDQPRDERGRFGSGGVGAGPASIGSVASAFHRGDFSLTATPAKEPTLTGMLDKLSHGQTVELKPGDVHTFLDVLHDKAQAGKDFDLATVAVAGQSIFHGEGPQRADMPQIPTADKEKFLRELADKGVEAKDEELPATMLRPTQREISGAKVTGMMDAADKGTLDLKSERIIVSRDGYVLDGHHRWAAAVGRDYEDGKPGDVKIPVTVINEDMRQLLPDANAFVDREHIGRVAFGAGSGKDYPWLFYGAPDYAELEAKAEAIDVKYSEDQSRDDHGRFGSGSGGSSAARLPRLSAVVSRSDIGLISDALSGIAQSPGQSLEDEDAALGQASAITDKLKAGEPLNRNALGMIADGLGEMLDHTEFFDGGDNDPTAIRAEELAYQVRQRIEAIDARKAGSKAEFDESLHPRRSDGKFGEGEGEKPHAVGVSADPNSQSLHTLTPGKQVSESPADYNDRVFREGQERYKPAADIESEAHDVRYALGLPDPKVHDWNNIEAPWERAEQVGQAFAAAKSDPNDPQVRAAYADLVDQTNMQFEHLTSPESEGGQGVTVDFVSPDDIREKYGDPEGLNPYPTAEAQRDDLVNNNHLAIASIADYPEAYHPLLSNTRGGEYDTFRAVHDAYGHAAIGADFTRHGEYQAYLHHTSMFEGPARLAASTELTGENSYLITTHQPAEHKAALLPGELLPDPWTDDGVLVKAWRRALEGIKSASKPKRVTAVGGEAEILARFGVTNSRNALYGKLARATRS